jgi:hypothetical protein
VGRPLREGTPGAQTRLAVTRTGGSADAVRTGECGQDPGAHPGAAQWRAYVPPTPSRRPSRTARSHSVAGMSAGSTVSETVNRFAWAMLLGEIISVRPWSAGACASAVPALGARCPAWSPSSTRDRPGADRADLRRARHRQDGDALLRAHPPVRRIRSGAAWCVRLQDGGGRQLGALATDDNAAPPCSSTTGAECCAGPRESPLRPAPAGRSVAVSARRPRCRSGSAGSRPPPPTCWCHAWRQDAAAGARPAPENRSPGGVGPGQALARAAIRALRVASFTSNFEASESRPPM